MTELGRLTWAPVVMTVYDREDHFRRTLTSLAGNLGAKDTVLYISSDGPKDAQALPRVARIREMIRELSGFKSVIVWAPQENTRGKIRNELLEHVKEKHESYIFSEDDNIFSPFFLRFMNEGLRRYYDNHQVRAVCGSLPPGVLFNRTHQVFLKSFSAWGFGTWSDRDHPRSPQQLASQVLKNPQLFRELNHNLPHLPRLSRRVISGNLEAEDVEIINDMYMRNQVCVFPPQTLVKNIGNDGSGINCRVDVRFDHQEVANFHVKMSRDIEVAVHGRDAAKFSGALGGRLDRMANWLIHLEYRVTSPLLRLSLGFVNRHSISLAGRMRSGIRRIQSRALDPTPGRLARSSET